MNFEGKTKPFDKFLLSLEYIIFKRENTFQMCVLGSQMFDK